MCKYLAGLENEGTLSVDDSLSLYVVKIITQIG